MFVDLSGISAGETVAVAVSGGQDSMALLHYLHANAQKNSFKLVCINVEHGIRGESSRKDSAFVASYCEKIGVPLIPFAVDALKKAETDKISVETAARTLRYECFYDAIKTKKCDKIATAHHRRDNYETILLNLFRGTGIKGLIGIKPDEENKIIRPFLSVTKAEIEEYISTNGVPFVTDETNLSTDYTRNALRLNVLPKIEELFPDAENAVTRLAETVKKDEEYLSAQAQSLLTLARDRAEIKIPAHYSVFARAVIIALKSLGVKKDWEKAHIDGAFSLIEKQNGATYNLLKGVTVSREYDKLVLTKNTAKAPTPRPIRIGEFEFAGKTYKIEKIEGETPDLKSGLFADFDKIPKTAFIRKREDGDVFVKFGGGKKSLGDYFTDKKIAKRVRDEIPLIANGNDILAIFGVAVSDKIKVDGATRNIIRIR